MVRYCSIIELAPLLDEDEGLLVNFVACLPAALLAQWMDAGLRGNGFVSRLGHFVFFVTFHVQFHYSVFTFFMGQLVLVGLGT